MSDPPEAAKHGQIPNLLAKTISNREAGDVHLAQCRKGTASAFALCRAPHRRNDTNVAVIVINPVTIKIFQGQTFRAQEES